MFSAIQAAILVGLGVIIESPQKRSAVLKSLDGIGKYAMGSINAILPKAPKPAPTKPVEPDEFR